MRANTQRPALACPALPAPGAQRTLAVELQRLSIQFRKQQKEYLNRLRSKDGGGAGGGGSSFNLLDEGRGRQQEEDFDPGFSEVQACKAAGQPAGAVVRLAGVCLNVCGARACT